jgi:hypothetical protein
VACEREQNPIFDMARANPIFRDSGTRFISFLFSLDGVLQIALAALSSELDPYSVASISEESIMALRQNCFEAAIRVEVVRDAQLLPSADRGHRFHSLRKDGGNRAAPRTAFHKLRFPDGSPSMHGRASFSIRALQ